MQRRSPLLMLGVSVLAATSTCLATNARCQSLDSILNAADKARLDLSATRTAQKIRESQLTEKPKVLVIDFFRGGNLSRRKKDGMPVPVRVPVELTFRLF
jgi:hypothetical protein